MHFSRPLHDELEYDHVDHLSPRFAATQRQEGAASADQQLLDSHHASPRTSPYCTTTSANRCQAHALDATLTGADAATVRAAAQLRTNVRDSTLDKPCSPFAAAGADMLEAQIADALGNVAGAADYMPEAPGVSGLGTTSAALSRHDADGKRRQQRQKKLDKLRARCRRLDVVDMLWIAVTTRFPVKEIRRARLRNEV